MTLFEHPIWPHVAPYARLDGGRANLDLHQLPDQLRDLALAVETNCVACGKVIHPLRARVLSSRSRVAGSLVEHRLFYAPTCPTDADPGCSRTVAARNHKRRLRELMQVAS